MTRRCRTDVSAARRARSAAAAAASASPQRLSSCRRCSAAPEASCSARARVLGSGGAARLLDAATRGALVGRAAQPVDGALAAVGSDFGEGGFGVGGSLGFDDGDPTLQLGTQLLG